MKEIIKQVDNNFSYREIDDIYYTSEFSMNFYGPTNSQESVKFIVYFHGGGLVEGSKESITPNFLELIKEGYACFSIDYPMYPKAKYPDYLSFSAKAIKYVFEHIKEYNGNGQIYVTGISAGAYITAMLNGSGFLEKEGIRHQEITGWIYHCGQLNDHFHYLEFEENLSPLTQKVSEHAPLFYVNENFVSSPILIIINKDDEFVNRNKVNYEYVNKVNKNNPEIDIKIFEIPGNHGHGTYLENGKYPINEIILPWLRNH